MMNSQEKQRQQYLEKLRKQEHEDAVMGIAKRMISEGKDYSDFTKLYRTTDGDAELFEQARAELEHEKRLDEAFLEGFLKDA